MPGGDLNVNTENTMMLEQLIVTAVCGLGLAAVVVVPKNGPTAWCREKARPALKRIGGEGVLDCVLCLCVWGALVAWAMLLLTGWSLGVAAVMATPGLWWLRRGAVGREGCSCKGGKVTEGTVQVNSGAEAQARLNEMRQRREARRGHGTCAVPHAAGDGAQASA